MKKSLKRQFQVQYSDYLWMFLIIACTALIGNIMFRAIVFFDKTATEYFAMGTVLGCMMAILYSGICGLLQMQTYFNVQVSMGSTRKEFFLSHILVSFVMNSLAAGILIVLGLMENAVNARMYYGWEREIDLVPYVIRWSIPFAALVPVISGFCGSLIMKFGKKASVTLWFLWMFACIGGPRIVDSASEAPDSFWGKVGGSILQAVKAVPGNGWFWLVILAVVLGAAGSWSILRKQQVAA